MNTQNKLTHTILPSGIRLSEDINKRRLIHNVDIFSFFKRNGFKNIQLQIMQAEASYASSSANNQLRETLANRPAVGPATQRFLKEDQYIESLNAGPTNTRSDTRERSRYSIAITSIIHVISHVYASNHTYRNQFIQIMTDYGFVPQYTSEVMKRTRISENKFFEITPSCVCDITTNEEEQEELKNTFFDPNFLLSQVGLTEFTSFLIQLHGKEGNYIPFVPATKLSLPVFNSGQQTTFCALTTNYVQTVDPSTGTLSYSVDKVYVTDHSMQNIESTMVADALISVPLFYTQDENGNLIEYTSHRETSIRINITNSSLQLSEHLTRRVLGLDKNHSHQGPASDVQETKQNNVKFNLDDRNTNTKVSNHVTPSGLQPPPVRRSNFRKSNTSSKDKYKDISFDKNKFSDLTELITRIVQTTVQQIISGKNYDNLMYYKTT